MEGRGRSIEAGLGFAYLMPLLFSLGDWERGKVVRGTEKAEDQKRALCTGTGCTPDGRHFWR